MSLERLASNIESMVARIDVVRGRGEAATSQALVLPMLEGLGYDIWNPREVCPEFEGDFAKKKAGQKEKADYAILVDGIPRIFIEVKAVDYVLDGHGGQIARYFNSTPSVSLGILTNGVEYWFFTDTGEPNIMDRRPFFVFQLDSPDSRVDVLSKFFSKAHFDAVAIRDYATDLIYTTKITAFLRDHLDLRGRSPSEDLVRWTLDRADIYDGRLVRSAIERFTPIVGSALNTVIRGIIQRSFAALDEGISEPESVPGGADGLGEDSAESVSPTDHASGSPPTMEETSTRSINPRIVTTDQELDAFNLVHESIMGALSGQQVWDPSLRRNVDIKPGYKDTTGYFALYLNKPSWWFARLWLDAKGPWIGFNADIDRLRPCLPGTAETIEGHSQASFGVRLTNTVTLNSVLPALIEAARCVIESKQSD